METRWITGFEALLRRQHPEQGLISPDKFIDAAEDTGLLFSVGHWLILEVCKQSWKNENPAQLVTVSVNLSAQQFVDSRFVTELQRALHRSGIAPSQLQLEITESIAAGDRAGPLPCSPASSNSELE